MKWEGICFVKNWSHLEIEFFIKWEPKMGCINIKYLIYFDGIKTINQLVIT